MKKIFKNAFGLLLTRIIFVVLSVFFIMAFSWLIEKKNGFLIYSIFTTLIYLFFIYSNAFEKGTKDKRYRRLKPGSAFAEGFISEIPSVALLIWLYFSGSLFKWANIVYLIWQAPYVGILAPGGAILDVTGVNVMYFAVLFFVPLVYGISYYAGGKTAKILTPENTSKEMKK